MLLDDSLYFWKSNKSFKKIVLSYARTVISLYPDSIYFPIRWLSSLKVVLKLFQSSVAIVP